MIAEKFHALAARGITNSRLKDYYDLWLIADTFELERAPLAGAVRQTFARRETALPQEKPTGFSKAYVETWSDQWRTFLTRERMAAAQVFEGEPPCPVSPSPPVARVKEPPHVIRISRHCRDTECASGTGFNG